MGKQISPNQIRSEIQKHIQETGKTQSKFMNDISVNSNSFGKFMKGAYKDQWSACQNGLFTIAIFTLK